MRFNGFDNDSDAIADLMENISELRDKKSFSDETRKNTGDAIHSGELLNNAKKYTKNLKSILADIDDTI